MSAAPGAPITGPGTSAAWTRTQHRQRARLDARLLLTSARDGLRRARRADDHAVGPEDAARAALALRYALARDQRATLHAFKLGVDTARDHVTDYPDRETFAETMRRIYPPNGDPWDEHNLHRPAPALAAR